MKTIATTPFAGQKPGTSGLRKKTREFMQPRYLENFIQSTFDATDLAGKTLVVGGDGRYFNREAIQKILQLAAGNGVGKVLVAQDGILSTPAVSCVIRAHGAAGGLVLSASHNPGGPDADFGVKYNASNGGPAPEDITERIYKKTLEISEYRMVEGSIPIDTVGTYRLGDTEVVVIDPLEDYTALMQSIFDFPKLKDFLKSGFQMRFDAMNGVTGPFAKRIFEDLLGAPAGSVIRATPLEDFGGEHPDPNLTYAADLVKELAGVNAPDFGAACDGDGDRNLILGRGCFVSPGDSLAIIAEMAPSCIPAYKAGLAGIARSMPTSMAADRVAAKLGIGCYETPTGWKFFGSLLDAGKITVCGEESFGTGSNHVREKDGLWAVLAWISILAHTKQSVSDVMKGHWERFGRSYYQRHDYESIPSEAADAMMAKLRGQLGSLVGTPMAGSTIKVADDFSYTDPVNGSVTKNQGTRLLFEDGSRAIIRLSGTGTEGATLRLYFEAYAKDDIAQDSAERIRPLSDAIGALLELKTRVGRDAPDVIT
ncbi:MAG: alpha-D-glucose phosphate-specific phosphoglucomutase [Bryobacteraceae bacterium]